jgi:phosphoribosylformylglycinamidine (FGAM) synthase-like enzyme
MPEIPEWISNALYLGGGGLLAWLTLLVTGRRDRKSAENQLIDQLQDELARFRSQTDARLEKLERENAAYRKFLFEQFDHMVAHGVQPLPWPETLPR